MTAEEVIATLALAPHPEGGHYRQTWVAAAAPGERPAGTCIYFLLARGERSLWHRVDAAEMWHHYAGAALVLRMAETEAGPARALRLGPDLAGGEEPQGLVPAGWWQAAETTGDWSLVGCTVSPGVPVRGLRAGAAGVRDPVKVDREVDARDLLCPLPVLRARKALAGMREGEVLRVLATDEMAAVDLPHFCAEAGHAHLGMSREDGAQAHLIRRGPDRAD